MTRPASFDASVMAERSSLRGFAMNLTRDSVRADDLVQDTILQALRFHESYKHDTNLGGWLRTMMRNIHYTQFRKNARLVEDPGDVMALMLEAPAEQEDRIELRHVLRAVERLTPDHREAIAFAMEEKPYEQIMSESGQSLGTVKSRLNRARAKLTEMVA